MISDLQIQLQRFILKCKFIEINWLYFRLKDMIHLDMCLPVLEEQEVNMPVL